jgi:hypothetical protein
MELSFIRTVVGIAVAALLTACGGAPPSDTPIQTAALMQDVAAGDPVASIAAAGVPAVGAHNPLPDCEPQACKGMRIIDGNAEAYRASAQRRAWEAELGGGVPQDPAAESVTSG